jgi:4-amino-4-deoxy-L-arabinose transferase-like glycosyltransferase
MKPSISFEPDRQRTRVPMGAAWGAILVSSALMVVVARVTGPGDLYEKDQPKTLAYTMDMVRNGRWALPRDVLGQPATKPPMYNWLSAIVVHGLGVYDEWALKWPSLLATAGVAGLCAVMVIALLKSDATGAAGYGAAAGWLAAAIWVLNGPVLRLMYLARPDMLQALFLTAAWMLGTAALRGANWPAAAGFWICVAGAALTKGPACILALLYVALGAKLLEGKWSAIHRLRWGWGLPLTVLCVAAWLGCAYRQDRDHVLHVMLGREMLHRALEGSPEGISHPFWMIPMWFGSKFLPWSIVVVWAGIRAWPRWFAHRMGPAFLWLGVLIVGFSLSAGKRIDYLLPAYAPGAVLSAWCIVEALARVGHRWRNAGFATAALATLALAVYLAHYNRSRTLEAKERFSDHTVAFVKQVRAIAGDGSLVVLVRGKHPITTLLGRHAGDGPTDTDLSKAQWMITPLLPDSAPRAVSALVPMGFELLAERPMAKLALYRAGDRGSPAFEQMRRMRNEMMTWTEEENPYRSARTDELIR